jgi:hypothetical protein
MKPIEIRALFVDRKRASDKQHLLELIKQLSEQVISIAEEVEKGWPRLERFEVDGEFRLYVNDVYYKEDWFKKINLMTVSKGQELIESVMDDPFDLRQAIEDFEGVLFLSEDDGNMFRGIDHKTDKEREEERAIAEAKKKAEKEKIDAAEADAKRAADSYAERAEQERLAKSAASESIIADVRAAMNDSNSGPVNKHSSAIKSTIRKFAKTDGGSIPLSEFEQNLRPKIHSLRWQDDGTKLESTPEQDAEDFQTVMQLLKEVVIFS